MLVHQVIAGLLQEKLHFLMDVKSQLTIMDSHAHVIPIQDGSQMAMEAVYVVVQTHQH